MINYKHKNGYYNISPMLSNPKFNFLVICGQGGVGKTFSAYHHVLSATIKNKAKFAILRLTDKAKQNLLSNGARELFDPLIVKKFKLEIRVRNDSIYYGKTIKTERIKKNGDVIEEEEFEYKGELCKVLALSDYYNDKGRAMFDASYNGTYYIVLDEMNRAAGERNTFNVIEALTEQIENLTRNTKCRVVVIMLGNNMHEASAIFQALNFIPNKPGVYRLPKRRAIIHLLEEDIEQKENRLGYVLNPNATRYKSVAQDEDIKKYIKPTKANARIVFIGKDNFMFTLTTTDVIRSFENNDAVQSAFQVSLYKNPFHKYAVNLARKYIEAIHARQYFFADEVIYYKVLNHI